ncbi:hypothetical protein Tco_0878311 [Tanacetum coccineum]|uniref:Uncharacterized protein n=1 Tax=Tanacetum coccineum TaxID=301880 RepID=A0ABQ5BXK0_9ASTR
MECQKPKRVKDAAYHKEKMLLYKQEEAGIQLSVEQVDWRDDTDDEPDDQELEAHYLYMAQIQEVTPDAVDNYGPIFDAESLQKVQNDNDNYNVFANDREHHEQPEYVNDTYIEEQGDTNITIDSLDMSTNGETADQDYNDLTRERELLASLIEKLKYEIDDSKNCNKFLETSNKALVDKLKSEIEDLKTKNKSLESSNNHFKEANNELSKTNQLIFKDLKKFQAELDRYWYVTDIHKRTKNKAKRTKLGTRMKRVQEIKAEGIINSNGPTRTYFIGAATLAILRSIIGGFDVEGNQGLKLIDQELVMIQGPGLKIEERLKGLESSSHHYK